jgi:hypothetical protein
MKLNKRQQKIADIVNRIFFVEGWNVKGEPRQQWIILPAEAKMKLKLNSSIKGVKKMKLKLNSSIQQTKKTKPKLNSSMQPKLGDLVTHKQHPLGLGLVVEKHPELEAFRVDWIEHANLTLFINEKTLVPINKEPAHESDGL